MVIKGRVAFTLLEGGEKPSGTLVMTSVLIWVAVSWVGSVYENLTNCIISVF